MCFLSGMKSFSRKGRFITAYNASLLVRCPRIDTPWQLKKTLCCVTSHILWCVAFKNSTVICLGWNRLLWAQIEGDMTWKVLMLCAQEMIFIDNFLSLPVGSLKVVDLKARRSAIIGYTACTRNTWCSESNWILWNFVISFTELRIY